MLGFVKVDIGQVIKIDDDGFVFIVVEGVLVRLVLEKVV